MGILDFLHKLLLTVIVLGLSLFPLGMMLSYFDITDVVLLLLSFTTVISVLLFVIISLIEYWRY